MRQKANRPFLQTEKLNKQMAGVRIALAEQSELCKPQGGRLTCGQPYFPHYRRSL